VTEEDKPEANCLGSAGMGGLNDRILEKLPVGDSVGPVAVPAEGFGSRRRLAISAQTKTGVQGAILGGIEWRNWIDVVCSRRLTATSV